MIDLDHLESIALAATPGPWRVGSYPAEIVGDTHVCIDTEFGVKVLLRGNENFYEEARTNAAFCAAADRDTVLALIAEVRALRKDKARLDSGCIMTNERDDFGDEYKCERRGNDLRKMIDEAIAARAKEPK